MGLGASATHPEPYTSTLTRDPACTKERTRAPAHKNAHAAAFRRASRRLAAVARRAPDSSNPVVCADRLDTLAFGCEEARCQLPRLPQAWTMPCSRGPYTTPRAAQAWARSTNGAVC